MSPEETAAFEKTVCDGGVLLAEDSVSAALNSQRPKIRLPGDNRELGQFAREVGEILARQDLFRRDSIVTVVNAEEGRFDPVSPDWLRTWAENYLVCFRDKEFGRGPESRTFQIVNTMSADTARATLAAPQFLNQLRRIVRVNPIRLPLLHRDGRIDLAPPGFCEESRVFTIANEVTFDEEMTPEQALETIRELLGEFPFADAGRSLAVQVAAMMTIFAAGLLSPTAARPGFIYTANDSDAGKTLAAKVAIIPIIGRVRLRAFPRKEELRKSLDQLAQDGATTVLFDNVKAFCGAAQERLGGEGIEAFMSSQRWSGRILGEKGGFDVDNVTTFFFSGNDSKPTRDMAQRCLFVELFLEQVDSSARTIRRVLNDAVLAEPGLRSRVCSALWTLVKSWDAAGRPSASSTMPKCPEWSAVIGGIVEHAGFGKVLTKPTTVASGFDYEMALLVRALYRAKAAHEWKFGEMIEVVKAERLFDEGSFFSGRVENAQVWDRILPDDAERDDREMLPAAKNSLAGRLAHYGRETEQARGRLIGAEDGGAPLRFYVTGKAHGRRFVVMRDSSEPVDAEQASSVSPS